MGGGGGGTYPYTVGVLLVLVSIVRGTPGLQSLRLFLSLWFALSSGMPTLRSRCLPGSCASSARPVSIACRGLSGAQKADFKEISRGCRVQGSGFRV